VSGAGDPTVRIENASISFGGNQALTSVNLALAAGEVMGLVGENGSGKSTLIKILNGVYRPDAGTRIVVRGEAIRLADDPFAFRRAGFSFVHQDLGLIPSLSVTENLLRDSVVHSRGPWVSWRTLDRRARALLAQYGVDVDPRQPVADLSDTERALVAIIRAVEELGPARTLLVLDEPTVFLPASGADLLFHLVHRLAQEEQMAVLLVSHDLEEVVAHADRITVLRGGEVRAELDPRDTTVAELSGVMVGRQVGDAVRVERPRGDVLVSVAGLASGRAGDVSFEVREGEVLGITGLAGSGFEDVLPAIYGARPASGSVLIGDREHGLGHPAASLHEGVVYVPADRGTEGGARELTVAENATLLRLRSLLGPLGLSSRRSETFADEFTERYDVRPRDGRTEFRLLSGGNQQKVVVGKWLDTRPRVVLLQDPTQGIDVGARAHINERLLAAAAEGTAILCATTDYEQLALICDRVLIVHDGRVVDEVTGPEVERNEIALRVVRSSPQEIAA
jgi:ribose transport system ATP-binding protein